ncbi:C-type lectin domain family 4 member E [Sarotherodon galilaeus]
MSSDINAKPDLSKKVRYSRKEQEDRAEWEQREVNTYESADEIRESYDDFQSQEGGPQTQSPPSVQKGSFRCATLALRVLCLLMLAGIIILQHRSTKNCSSFNDHWRLLLKKCPDRWTRFGSSCYFKSTERKTWSESRRDCQDKGADLVMINSKEEQEFINELNMRGESWIGLRAKQTSGGYKWEWVDGSALTQTFWAKEHEIPSYGYYGVCCDSDGRWTQSLGYNFGDRVSKTFICEK